MTAINIESRIDVLEVAKELEGNAHAFGDTKNKAKKNAVFYLRSQFERIAYLEQQVRDLFAEQPKPPEAAPVHQPLTDKALDAMRQADNGQLNFVTLRQFRIIARAIERAHGIHPDTP